MYIVSDISGATILRSSLGGWMYPNTFTEVLYLSTALRYLHSTWVFQFYTVLYFYSITIQREMLYFLLHSLNYTKDFTHNVMSL